MIKGSSIVVSSASKGRNGRLSEDRHKVIVSDEYTFVGVYDGHGGHDVVDFVHQRLHLIFFECLETNSVEEALERAFLRVDEEMREEDRVLYRMQGTTATVVYIRDGITWIANVGDSRAVSSSGERLTVEDSARTNVEEMNRIRQEGGRIQNGRVDLVLAITRAIGDGDFKPHVTARPHIRKLTSLTSLVVASDGFWDLVLDDQISSLVLDWLSADDLIKWPKKRYLDDVTVVLIKVE